MDNSFEENLLNNIRKNIAWILKRYYNNSQTLMAKDLDIKTNTLNTYLNTSTKPPITFICKLCNKNDIEIDSFISEDLTLMDEKTRKKEAVKKIYNKYKGNYYAYFFVIDSNSLKEGLIQEGIIEINDSGFTSFEIINSKKIFKGNFMVSDELVFFDLKNLREKINIVIKNPGKGIKERYTGGMGIINISSPEDNRIPSAQKVIISSVRIPIDKYFKTLNDFLLINPCIKIKKRLLIELLVNKIMICTEKYESLKELLEDNKISDEDKILLYEKQMNLLQKVLDKHEMLDFKKEIMNPDNAGEVILTNSIKINLEDDNLVYRFIKNEFRIITQ